MDSDGAQLDGHIVHSVLDAERYQFFATHVWSLTRNRRYWLAGVPVDAITESEILQLLTALVQSGQKLVLANVNLHGIYCALRSPQMARLLTDPATLVHIDGTPLLWLARLFISEVPWSVRNAHIDLLPKMLSVCAERGWPVCIVASDVAGALENRRTLEALHPKLILNTYEGYFEEDKPGEAREKEILESIRGSGAKLLLVGRGMPKQEEWIVAVKDQLNVPMIMPIGGFTDYVTGRSKTPPRFLGPSGLEWAYRLVHDPRRLAFRYLLEPLLLLGLILRASLHRAAWGRCAEQGPDPPQ